MTDNNPRIKFYKVISGNETTMFLVHDGLAINKSNGQMIRFYDLRKAVIICKQFGVNINIVQSNSEEYENF